MDISKIVPILKRRIRKAAHKSSTMRGIPNEINHAEGIADGLAEALAIIEDELAKEKAKGPTVESWELNGVSVKVTHWPGSGSVCETTCQCLGYPFRVHSNIHCPNKGKLDV